VRVTSQCGECANEIVTIDIGCGVNVRFWLVCVCVCVCVCACCLGFVDVMNAYWRTKLWLGDWSCGRQEVKGASRSCQVSARSIEPKAGELV
jgi:hypothetical protein